MLESLVLSSEIFSGSFLLIVFFYLLWRKRTQKPPFRREWSPLLGGFGLLLVGNLLDIGHELAGLNSSLLTRENDLKLLLVEKGVVLPLGYLLLLLGLLRWMPTGTRSAQPALRPPQTRLQHLFTTSPAVIYSSQPHLPYGTTFISENIQSQLGYTPQDFLADPNFWFAHVHPGDRERVLAELSTLFHNNSLCYEYRFRHRDGRYRWMHDEQRLVRAADGQPQEIVGYWIDITERKQSEEAYRQHQEFLQTLLDHLPVLIACFDSQGRFQWINRGFERALGWSLEELKQEEVKQGDSLAVFYPDPAYRQQVHTFIQEAHTQWADFRMKTRDGRTLDITGVIIKLSDGRRIGIGQDITERKRAEQTQRRLSAILEASTDFVGWADSSGIARYINRAGCQMIGMTPEKAIGQPITAFSPDWANIIIQSEGLPKAKQHGSWRGETALLDGHGREIPVSQLILAHRTPEGKLEFYSTVARDIRERKAYETQLEHQANYDRLTGLPNRNLLQERLKLSLAHARRSRQRVAVLFLNLDRFKRVNDSLGHSAGDALLQAVAARLSACIREEDTVARLGNDEFVLVLEDLSPNCNLRNLITHKILSTLSAPFQIAQQKVFVSAWIGVSLFPRDGDSPPLLLKQADIAMHYAKKRGWHGIQFYTAGMNVQTTKRFTLENCLWHALEQEELEIHYQPQVDLSTGQIIGAEALLRWRHPTLGLISPAEFIPLAEESGLIVPIGQWVLRTACAQVQAWHTAGLPPVTLAVNLSARQFLQANLVELVTTTIRETGLAAERLELEITESLLMQDVEGAIALLHTLKTQGIQLAIDDFGTGYSSLNYLKRFPLDLLKIDRAFVRDITTEPDDAAITHAVIALAKSLKLKVIAEGVETEAQLAFLQAKGCHAIQGYYFSPPLPAEKFAHLLHKNPRMGRPLFQAYGAASTLLVIDSNPYSAAALRRLLRGEPYRILVAFSVQESLDLLASHPVEVVVANHSLPKTNGAELLRRIRSLYPETVGILLIDPSIQTSLLTKAINEGIVFKFLPKPLSEKRLRSTLREAFLFHRALCQHTA